MVKDQKEFVFERIEKKYLLTQNQFHLLQEYIQPYMAVDDYGKYTITNIYYDTWDYRLIRQSLEKPIYKEKLRLRSYGVPNADTKVFVELKKKYQKVVYKRREELTLAEAERLLNDGQKPTKKSQILEEIFYFIKMYQPIPSQFIGYDRQAYFGIENPMFRLTIDSDIRYRNSELLLERGDYGHLLLPEKTYLMELKIPQAIPLWFVDILEKLEIRPVHFSKYGKVYQTRLEKELLFYSPHLSSNSQRAAKIYHRKENSICLQA